MVTLDEAGRDAPPLRLVARGSPLAPFVELTSIQPGPAWARSGDRRRIVPDPAAHLVVAAYEGGGVRASLVGARTRFCDADARRRFTVAVRFRPGALPRLTGLPAHDLTDRGAPLGDILPGAAEVLDAAAADDAEACLAAAERLLVRRLADAAPVDWRVRALEAALARPGAGPRVADVAGEMGIGRRTLRAAAGAEVGLSPARWRRVQRVLTALGRILGEGGNGGEGWARIAAHAGYHDQPHLVRDFQALLGESPSAFLGRRGAAVPYKTGREGRAHPGAT